jgi:hypothetical protein
MEEIYQIGKKWSIEEDQQLLTEYNSGNNIVEIAQLHKRLPNCIATRLVRLNIIENTIDARGFREYKNSNYYQTYLQSEKRQNFTEKVSLNKTKTKISNLISTITDNADIYQDISNIKKELNDIKASIFELKEMLNIYEFDDC